MNTRSPTIPCATPRHYPDPITTEKGTETMNTTKKLVSILLTLVMLLSLTATAFATGTGSDGSITISNATVGAKYAIYKVFDLTYSDDGVAYSYTKTGESDALYAALTGEGSPFTLTPTTTTDVYNVSLKAEKTAADVSAFLKTNADNLTQVGDTKEAENATVTFDGLDYGYYYITSSLGAVVTVNSTTPNVTVIDKNQAPGWDPEDPEKPDESGETGKFVANAETGTYGKTSTAAINDTAYFKINAYAPKYAGDKLVSTYVFTDTLADGFTFKNDIAVKLGENALASDTDYSVNVDGQKITVTVNAGTIADYPVEAHLSITYSADVDTDAVYDNTNTVSMSWTVYPNDDDGKPDKDKEPYDPNDPNNPDKDPEDPDKPGDSDTDTYVFGFMLQKYKESAAAGNELTGAKFKLYADATGGTAIELVKVSDGVYRVAGTNEQGTTTEIEAGFAQIFGLDAKTYYLEETVAPAGYNILTERVAVAISSDAEYHTNGIMNDTNNIINNAGTLLPSTGGMGTTLFYVLGSLLAVCAVVLLIAKRRMTRAER